jgi:hypothetical protein
MLQEKFVPFGAGADGVAAPDKPDPRPILGGVRILHGEFQIARFQLVHNILDNLSLTLSALSFSLLSQFDRTAIELGEEGQPAPSDGAHLVIDGMVVQRLGEGVIG